MLGEKNIGSLEIVLYSKIGAICQASFIEISLRIIHPPASLSVHTHVTFLLRNYPVGQQTGVWGLQNILESHNALAYVFGATA